MVDLYLPRSRTTIGPKSTVCSSRLKLNSDLEHARRIIAVSGSGHLEILPPRPDLAGTVDDRRIRSGSKLDRIVRQGGRRCPVLALVQPRGEEEHKPVTLADRPLIAPPTVKSQGLLPLRGTSTRSALPPCTFGSLTRLALAPFTSGALGSLTICLVRSFASCAATIVGGATAISTAAVSVQLTMSSPP